MTCYEPTSPFRGEDGGIAPGDLPVIRTAQNVTETVQISIVDDKLTTDFAYSTPDAYVPLLIFREGWSTGDIIKIVGSRPDDTTFSFDFTPTETACGGIFVGNIALFDTTDTEYASPLWVTPIYVAIEANLTADSQTPRPLSIAEIRMLLRDLGPSFNNLLDDYEFTDHEIALCIQRVVDEWNEKPPKICTFTYVNFPYRYHWSIAVMSKLLKIAARQYERNNLTYSAAGVSVNDTARYQSYIATADRLEREWREFMVYEKGRLNWDASWGYA